MTIKACCAFVLVVVIALSSLTITAPQLCSAETKIVNHTVYFHNYSVVLRDENGSFIAYNGADENNPTGSGAQVTLQSQITGTRDGWAYYSAVAIWATPLQTDTHVKGTVTIEAYISSKFSLTGLFSGGGYGFGVVDIDANNNEVQEFVTEGPISIGRNPFTQDPSKYSISINVDYIFKKGHSIGFAVGFGATVKGFEATIYFDSAARNSGANVPVEETTVDPTPTPTLNPTSTPSTSSPVAPEYPTCVILPAIVVIFTSILATTILLKSKHKTNY